MCLCVHTCVFIHVIPVCMYIQHFIMIKFDKVVEVAAVHNEHLSVASTAKPLFSVSYFIRAHASGFPQGITQCILVLQHFIIYFIRTLTFPVSLGSLVHLIIKHFKIELLQFMCIHIHHLGKAILTPTDCIWAVPWIAREHLGGCWSLSTPLVPSCPFCFPVMWGEP